MVSDSVTAVAARRATNVEIRPTPPRNAGALRAVTLAMNGPRTLWMTAKTTTVAISPEAPTETPSTTAAATSRPTAAETMNTTARTRNRIMARA
jgi:hypothetical protein